MSKNGLELLAPAGNLNILKSVVNAGADAVYFGGDMFGARAFANNFSEAEVLEGIHFAHVRGVKCNLTVNTLLKNREIEQKLYSYIKPYYEAGLDAVIVQDFGVFNFLKYYFPEMELHASTQMTIANTYGAKFLLEQGASRIVLARELSLDEINRIYEETGAEIESFVHGALCVSYSGQCLMSSVLGGRSGNRGRCAQPCRLPYEVIDNNGNRVNKKGDYVLSLKDFNNIDNLKAMHEAGVYSLKIEGRMKSMEYASGVVSVYKRSIDKLLLGEEYSVSENDNKLLFDLGNRCGFTDLYLKAHNGKEMVTFVDPAHKKAEVNLNLKDEQKLFISGRLDAHVLEPLRLTIKYLDNEVSISSDMVEAALNRATTASDIEEKLRKTGATSFEFKTLDINLDNNAFIPLKTLNELRRNALEELENRLDSVRRTAIDFDSRKYNFSVRNTNINTSLNGFLSVSVESKEQLKEVLGFDFVDEIIIPVSLAKCSSKYVFNSELMISGKKIIVKLPEILRKRSEDYLDEFIGLNIPEDICFEVSSFDGLNYLISRGISAERIKFSHRMYTYNNVSLDAYRSLGFNSFVAPVELNEKELKHRDNRDSRLLIYGRLPLMTMANCVHSDTVFCDKKKSVLYLKDRYGKLFPVINHCDDCFNIIYNSCCFQIITEGRNLDNLGFLGYRMEFTIENGSETKRILEFYKEIFINGVEKEFPYEYTKGHFRRGVE